MSISGITSALKSQHLDWKKRPQSLQSAISCTFNKIMKASESSWGLYNGDSKYYMCSIDEEKLMKKVILQSPQQKEFYALDIGAGNFQWGRSIAEFINRQNDLPKDIKVNIISIRGEKNLGDRVIEEGCCRLYELGAFKIEEMIERFRKEGLFLEKKVDLVLSRWCFRHLVDPVGTFIQLFNLLRPKKGFLLMDGFYFLFQGQNLNLRKTHLNRNINMIQLLFDTKALFLMLRYDRDDSLNRFVLQRPNEKSCELPMKYEGVERIDSYRQLCYMTRFVRSPQEEDELELNDVDRDHLYGDIELFRFLRKNKVFDDDYLHWKPLRKKDYSLRDTRLHQAVSKGYISLVKKHLQEGCDIDEFDENSDTALHIAIRQKNWELFKLLLREKADMGLYNNNERTSLHEAVVFDKDGSFIEELIKAGADVNAHRYRTYLFCRPLELAIEKQNVNAARQLLQNGAEISISDYDHLYADETFSTICRSNLVPTEMLGFVNYFTLKSWIQQGDIVVPHSAGEYDEMLFPETEGKNRRLIFIDINCLYHPVFKGKRKKKLVKMLVDEVNGLAFIHPYDKEKIENLGYSQELHFKLKLDF